MLRVSRQMLIAVVVSMAIALVSVVDASDLVCQTGTCQTNGDIAVCDRSTGSCPPCMYAIPGGYSCYSMVGSSCPYPDTVAICAPATASTTAPDVLTPAPAPASDTTGSSSAASSSSAAAAASSTASSSTTMTPAPTEASLPVTTQPVGTVAPSNSTSDPSTSTTDTQDALNTDAATTAKQSPAYVNVAIICGAVIGVLVVVMFIVRRVRQRRDDNPSMDDLDFKTPQGGGDPHHHKENFGQVPTTTRRGQLQQSMLYTSTQPLTDRIDFSMLEPMDSTGVHTKTHESLDRPPSSRPSSSVRSDTRAASTLEFSISSSRRPTVPVDQDAPAGRCIPIKSRVRGMDSSIIQKHYPELAGPSAGYKSSIITKHFPELAGPSSYKSDVSSLMGSEKSNEEYDIVDPGAIRPGERRNTETLVADGRFRQFSTMRGSDMSDATTDESSEYSHSVYV